MDPAHRVLIIDDNAVNRRMAQVVFQKLGWEAETLDSGEGALLHLAAHRYDLVLLDISMPGMNGLEVCQRIRADHTLAGGVSNVDMDRNNTLQIKAIGVAISTFETLPSRDTVGLSTVTN